MPDNPYQSPQAPAAEYASRPSRPWWVSMALWGTGSRTGAMAFVWGNLLIASAFAVFSFYRPWVLPGIAMAVAALIYWRAIRWVDRHDGWTPSDEV